jgi:hypothetical protein
VFSFKEGKRKRILPGRNILQLECGGGHCIALDSMLYKQLFTFATDLGCCWAWGLNDCNQLGFNSSPQVYISKAQQITKIKESITKVYAGWRSSCKLLITISFIIYSRSHSKRCTVCLGYVAIRDILNLKRCKSLWSAWIE